MKKKIFLFLLMVLCIISGCSTTNESDFDRFSLEILGLYGSEEEGSPYLYIVNPREAPSQVRLATQEMETHGVVNTVYEIFDLEGTTVTDEKIIIAFNGEELNFTRLSDSVVINENNIRYQYREIE